MEDFQKAGKTKSIGVSNYCKPSLECLSKTWKVKPAINQLEGHMGMGPDPQGVVSYAKSLGIASQAYSPLGDGNSELITGELMTKIGKAHNVTGTQISIRWITEHGIAVTTRRTEQSHMVGDLNILSFLPTADEITPLDKAFSSEALVV